MGTSSSTVLIGLAAAALAACGPSALELRQAREARYDASRDDVFRLAHAAVASAYAVTAADPATGVIATDRRWYEPDGGYVGTDEHDRESGLTMVTEAGAVLLGFEVRVVGESPPFQVLVAPVAQARRSNYSALYTYLPDDPELPGWIVGKVDNLQLEVHHRLERQLAPTAVARN